MSKTFQDALQVTCGLGFEYIWIESLRIVQDDPDDWAAESAKMADIYNTAILTVMAASASDGDGGCFQERPLQRDIIPIPYTNGTETSLSVYVGRLPPGYEETVLEGPLFKRAWVFQERLLSKRKLIFGQDQTYWDCDGSILPESHIPHREQSSGFAEGRAEGRGRSLRIFSEPFRASRSKTPTAVAGNMK